MSDFLTLSSELAGFIPGLSPLLAEKFINDAWADIRNIRAWSFLLAEGAIVCPTQITAGSCAIVYGSDQVTLDATASAAWAAATVPPSLESRQMRFGVGGGGSPGPGQASQVYNITSIDTANPNAYVVTLDRVVVQSSNAGQSYKLYRCYVPPPASDFKTWQSLVDMANGLPLKRDRTSWDLDRLDPQRLSQGLAYWLCGYQDLVSTPGSSTFVSNVPYYELWPHPVSGQVFYARFRRRGVNFVDATDEPPAVISDQLILQRALGWYAFPHAMMNQAHFPTMKGTSWATLIQNAKSQYLGVPGSPERGLLQAAIVADDTQQNQSVLSRGYRRGGGRGMGDFPFPIDANFLQSHLVSW